MTEFRFVFNGLHSLQISSKDSQGAFADINFPLESVAYWGERYKFNYTDAEILRNGKFLFANKEYYIAISDNQPIIEIYSRRNRQKVQSYDYSEEIEIVKDHISYLNSLASQGSNSYNILCGDACVYNDQIYLLLATNRDRLFYENAIAVFELYPELKIKEILSLPNEVYTTFCVVENTIFAFNRENTVIKSFNCP